MVSSKPSEGYRPDVDGLRAIAVLSVVVFHAFPAQLRGGYVGVDIFFVISGFLISGIILREQEKGRFSLVRFYSRRVRRIAPALYVLLAAVLSAGLLLLLPFEMRRLGLQIASSSMFASNIQFWTEAGYFAPASNSNPLLHIWSLGVEEQFYFIWPTFLLVAVRLRRLMASMLLLLVLSSATAIVMTRLAPSAAFYLTPFRLWEFIVGALIPRAAEIATYLRERLRLSPLATGLVQNTAALVGAALLIGGAEGVLRLPRDFEQLAILPVFGAGLLILVGPASIIGRLLAAPPAVFIGKISYSLYLWHWPILSFLYINYAGRPTQVLRVEAVMAAVILAVVSWKFVETPVRERKVLSRWNDNTFCWSGLVLAVAFALLGAACALGVLRPVSNLAVSQQTLLERFTSRYGEAYVPTFERITAPRCDFLRRGGAPPCPRGGVATIVLWGDSHAQHLYPGLLAELPASNTLWPALTGCAPTVRRYAYQNSQCDEANRHAFERIRETRPDVVILAGRWKNVVSDPEFYSKLDETVSMLKSVGVTRVLLVGQTPEWSPDLYKLVARHYLRGGKPTPEYMAQGADSDVQEIESAMARHFASQPVGYISLQRSLCNLSGCLTRVGPSAETDLIAFDYGHLTESGSRYVARNIVVPAIAASLTGR